LITTKTLPLGRNPVEESQNALPQVAAGVRL
jgi:hypothetical protein